LMLFGVWNFTSPRCGYQQEKRMVLLAWIIVNIKQIPLKKIMVRFHIKIKNLLLPYILKIKTLSNKYKPLFLDIQKFCIGKLKVFLYLWSRSLVVLISTNLIWVVKSINTRKMIELNFETKENTSISHWSKVCLICTL
jgi:hypothetical protein